MMNKINFCFCFISIFLIESICEENEKKDICGQPRNVGCTVNKKCTTFALNKARVTIGNLRAETPSLVYPQLFSYKNVTLSFTKDFLASVDGDICSNYCNDTCRRDNLHLTYKNFGISGSFNKLDLSDMKSARNIVDEICHAPNIDSIPGLPESFSDKSCSNVSINNLYEENNSFRVRIQDVPVLVDYTLCKHKAMIINYSTYTNFDVIVPTEVECNGSELFKVACECAFKSDFFRITLLKAINYIYTCLIQVVVDQKYFEPIYCMPD